MSAPEIPEFDELLDLLHARLGDADRTPTDLDGDDDGYGYG